MSQRAREDWAHGEHCPCVLCVCRRHLSWRPNEEGAVKIARWDSAAGTGEPDRGIDITVARADLDRALEKVTDPWLRIVGRACRDVGPGSYHPHGCNFRGADGFHPYRCPNRVPWPDRAWLAPNPERWAARPGFFVVDHLKARYPLLWAQSAASHPEFTLSALRELCAKDMARTLGQAFGGPPTRPQLSILADEGSDPVRGLTYR
ncbi:MAG: hypothetical protein WBF51_04315 [Candidatus Dormiibacterota bacterium]